MQAQRLLPQVTDTPREQWERRTQPEHDGGTPQQGHAPWRWTSPTPTTSPRRSRTLGVDEAAVEGVEYREFQNSLLEDLPPREKRILLLRFFGNMTQSQIAQEAGGISQMRVPRLLARTLAQLRERHSRSCGSVPPET
ncbi:sigma-70 family RNA polymerase sigma factor [Streptomyces sp. NRRL S-646]|uniref:sigma-70 family RNA polymerase sigma factor n=1 Tax=Streptomyces sp. NRRL S-646 TaxID=1463917 RepID=UPI0004CB17B7|nr:sigma-70 family RNA polymerase sigma factor [Streptomyces sp. NRRL S-646]